MLWTACRACHLVDRDNVTALSSRVTASRMILFSELSSQMELVVVAHTYNLSTREAGDEEFKASLGYPGFCLNLKQTIMWMESGSAPTWSLKHP